jgi:hypothetical protein
MVRVFMLVCWLASEGLPMLKIYTLAMLIRALDFRGAINCVWNVGRKYVNHMAATEIMMAMAAVLRDPYRVHWDREATRELCLECRVINQGPLNLSYIVNMLHSFSGPTSVRRLTVSFGRPVFDADSVVAGGEISAIDGDRVLLEQSRLRNYP